jgi:hypothetical protein
LLKDTTTGLVLPSLAEKMAVKLLCCAVIFLDNNKKSTAIKFLY